MGKEFEKRELSAEDQGMIIKEAYLYLELGSYQKVADELGLSYNVVRRDLKYKLRYVDRTLFDRLNPYSKKSVYNVDFYDERTINRILKAYHLFIDEGLPLQEVCNVIKASPILIYVDLTKILRNLKNSNPNVTEEMLEKVTIALENNQDSRDKSTLEILEKLYPTREKLVSFLSSCTVSFGLSLDSLSHILNKKPSEVYDEFMKSSVAYKDSLVFHFLHGFTSQDVAMENFLEFLGRLAHASASRDREEAVNILSELGDKEIISIKNNYKPGAYLQEYEILAILKYQLKYGLTRFAIAEFFGFDAKGYNTKVYNLESKYPELVGYYMYVEDYYGTTPKGRR